MNLISSTDLKHAQDEMARLSKTGGSAEWAAVADYYDDLLTMSLGQDYGIGGWTPRTVAGAAMRELTRVNHTDTAVN